MNIESNTEKIKLFEQIINTTDEIKAEELIDSNASFITPASPTPLYVGQRAIYLSYIG